MQQKGTISLNSNTELNENRPLKVVFVTFYPALCLFADKLLHDRPAAEDIVENLFIKLWEREPDLSRYRNIKAVLYTGVKNACLDYIEKQRNRINKQNAFAYVERNTEDHILNEIIRAEILREAYAEIQAMPPECRKVMQLYFQEGQDAKTIAAQLGITISTVRNQKARGIKTLKRKLGTSFLLLSGFPLTL